MQNWWLLPGGEVVKPPVDGNDLGWSRVQPLPRSASSHRVRTSSGVPGRSSTASVMCRRTRLPTTFAPGSAGKRLTRSSGRPPTRIRTSRPASMNGPPPASASATSRGIISCAGSCAAADAGCASAVRAVAKYRDGESLTECAGCHGAIAPFFQRTRRRSLCRQDATVLMWRAIGEWDNNHSFYPRSVCILVFNPGVHPDRSSSSRTTRRSVSSMGSSTRAM
jgi:hypothetical protein